MKHLIKRKKRYNKSYSQSGEDLIVRRALSRMHIKKPVYIDIGAHHPVKLNNTYLLYKEHGNGLLIEPNPAFIKHLKAKRKRDIILPYGLGATSQDTMDFFIMSNDYLSTFSKEEAENIENEGKNSIVEIIKVPIITVEEVIRTYLKTCPNYISLDTEWLDFEILKSWDFHICQPEVFCVETITYTQSNTEKKRNEIFQFMHKKGYMVYADTYINTIFIDEKKWRNR